MWHDAEVTDDVRLCSKCLSRQVVVVDTTPDATMFRCENCGREWTVIERFIERRRNLTDRRRVTRGDRRKS